MCRATTPSGEASRRLLERHGSLDIVISNAPRYLVAGPRRASADVSCDLLSHSLEVSRTDASAVIGRLRVRLPARARSTDPVGPGYRWIVLSNTTLAQLMATLNMSSVLIALPAIFRGIHLDPLEEGNFNYLLWMLMGYMLVTAVAVVNLGRLGDMYGRVRMYNLGFVVFTLTAVALSSCRDTGTQAALTLIVLRMVQALGGALLMANTAALLTDAFPEEHRGMALGLNQVVGLAGTFFGLLAGGLLATVDWRLVFLINVPVGLFGTVWSYWKLRELGERVHAPIDWARKPRLRRGSHHAARRRHLRDPPLRRPHDGLARTRSCSA